MKILINLIGEQPSPNYFAIKIIDPEIILSVYTNLTQNVYSNLKTFFNNKKFVDVLVKGFDYEEINIGLLEKLNIYKDDGNDFFFNITGGNKLMSLIAYDLSKKFNSKAIYIDSQNQLYYTFENGRTQNNDLNINLKILEYFNLHGIFNLKQEYKEASKEEKIAKEKIISFFLKGNNFRKTLNLTRKITKYLNNLKETINSTSFKIENGTNYLEWNRGKGVIHYTFKNQNIKLDIPSESVLEYHNGKWFEDVYKNKLIESGEFDEVISNLTIYADKKLPNNETVSVNEIDILAIKNGKLTIFECKTGIVTNSVIEKLQSIKDLLGKFATIKLITSYKLQENTKNEIAVKQKLKYLNIENIPYF